MLESIVCLAIAKSVIFNKIEFYAKEFGVSESLMTYIVINESAKTKNGDFLPCGIGDTHLIDPNGNPHRSRGIVQINEFYNKNISDEEAFNVDFSLHFLATEIRLGRCSRWTTCRMYMKLYNET